MDYQTLLKDKNWGLKRYDILVRDSFSCMNCSNDRIKQSSKVGVQIDAKLHGSTIVTINYGRLAMMYRVKVQIKERTSGLIREGIVRVDSKLLETLTNSDNNICYFFFENQASINILLIELAGSQIFIKGLHIHHRYYQDGKLPWEYPDEALQTLCWHCHKELHENTMIEWRNSSGKPIGTLTPCFKCHGAGAFPEYQHVQGGICFQCHGAKYLELFEAD